MVKSSKNFRSKFRGGYLEGGVSTFKRTDWKNFSRSLIFFFSFLVRNGFFYRPIKKKKGGTYYFARPSVSISKKQATFSRSLKIIVIKTTIGTKFLCEVLKCALVAIFVRKLGNNTGLNEIQHFIIFTIRLAQFLRVIVNINIFLIHLLKS